MWEWYIRPAGERAERMKGDTPPSGVIEPKTKEGADAALALLKSLLPGKTDGDGG